jgi:hypothetical protein
MTEVTKSLNSSPEGFRLILEAAHGFGRQLKVASRQSFKSECNATQFLDCIIM